MVAWGGLKKFWDTVLKPVLKPVAKIGEVALKTFVPGAAPIIDAVKDAVSHKNNNNNANSLPVPNSFTGSGGPKMRVGADGHGIRKKLPPTDEHIQLEWT